MNSHRYISAYLAPPTIRKRKRPGLAKLPQIIRWGRSKWPQAGGRAWVGIGLWLVLFSTGLYASKHQTIPVRPPAVAADPGSIPAAATKAPAGAVRAVHLPGGPSGQLLPPGTMAPPRTYPNSYTSGQCTWYVAGRRPLPRTWGHARTWLSRAQAQGWRTGSTPAIGAVAWTNDGRYGHLALVEDVDPIKDEVLISEMNYYGPYIISKRWVPAIRFKYIY